MVDTKTHAIKSTLEKKIDNTGSRFRLWLYS